MTKKIRVVCGLTFERLSNSQRYCSSRGEAHEADQMREYRIRYERKRRQLRNGSEQTCPLCGVLSGPPTGVIAVALSVQEN